MLGLVFYHSATDVNRVIGGYEYPEWSFIIGWAAACSSIACVPAYAVYRLIFRHQGSLKQARLHSHTLSCWCRLRLGRQENHYDTHQVFLYYIALMVVSLFVCPLLLQSKPWPPNHQLSHHFVFVFIGVSVCCQLGCMTIGLHDNWGAWQLGCMTTGLHDNWVV